MSKVTDEQILALHLQVEAKKITIKKGCEQLNIARGTFYNRLATIQKLNKALNNIEQNIQETLPLTIEKLDKEANDLLNELIEYKNATKGTKDYLPNLDRLIRFLPTYRRALQKAGDIYIDKIDMRTLVLNTLPQDVQKRFAGEFLKELHKRITEEGRCPFEWICKKWKR